MRDTTTPAAEGYIDAAGDRWLPLPDSARYDQTEGAFLVAGTPVMTSGDHYLDESSA